MTFASLTYILFFLFTISLLGLTNIGKVRNALGARLSLVRHVILLLASYVFYGWWDWRFCFLMLFVTAVAYVTGVFKNNKFLLITSVCIVLAVLGIFKYYNFFVESFCDLFSISTKGTISIILPVGISFYTFQAISYMIDVYKNKIEPEKNFIHVALYISFFPQLVAGPIVKASEFLPQLKQDRNVSIHNLEAGVQIFVFGMFKKIVLADNLSVYVDEVFEHPMAFSAGTICLAVLSYAMQIYFDFSGYSDMAIGSARCLGYELTRNFNLPYISQNVSEFWKRWHISLSNWLMEYLYIPLGGNRKRTIRTYINLMLTMVIGGLWHGANWTFVIWGALHGIALCVHKIFVRKIGSKDKNLLGKIISILMTNLFVCFCWIFFRADNINTAITVISRIFTFSRGITHIYSWTLFALVLLVICHVSAYCHSKQRGCFEGYYKVFDLNKVSSLVILFVMIGLTIGLAYTGSSPFIYFQF